MNKLNLVWLLVLALAFVGCDETTEPETSEVVDEVESEDESENVAEAAAAIDLSAIASNIGGVRMVAGQFGVELLPQASGVLKAYVSKADGSAVQDAEVAVAMKGTDGATHTVSLAFDASVSAYVGTMSDSTPATGEASVTVTAEGATAEAQVETIAVAPAPVYGGHVVVLGDMAAEIRPEADGMVFVTAQRPDGIVNGSADVNMKASFEGEGGAEVDVALIWDEPTLAFVGVAPNDAALTTGGLTLWATVEGVEHHAGLPQVNIAAPTHEGDIIAAGDLSVELVAVGETNVEAYVTDASGDAVASAADVSIELPGADAPTNLAWDAGAGCYKGEVAADVDVSTAPIAVNVVHQGRARRGGIAVAAGRALGVTWRSRVASGAGGAIPPGQAMKLDTSAEVRGRVSASANANVGVEVAAGAGAGAQGRARAEAAMANASAMAAAGQARGEAARAQNRARGAAVQAQGAAANARGQAEAAHRASVMVRAPAAPMVSAGASAMGNGSGGGGSAMGSASVMVGF